MEPITRNEVFLAAAGGDDITLPKPVTREEFYLAKAAGEDVETPSPVLRVEFFLDKIAKGGGGGVKPEGTLDILENGTYDVTNYASAEVAVPIPDPQPGLRENLLWENHNPTAVFNSQSISLNSTALSYLASADLIRINWRLRTMDDTVNYAYFNAAYSRNNTSQDTMCLINSQYRRTVALSNSGIVFKDAAQFGRTSTDGSWCIPIAVYAVNVG